MEEGVGRMRTNLAERRIGYEPPEIPEGESLEERRERIRAIYQWRKAMRRLARLGCIWLSGVGFALCIIAGCAHATEIAAVLGGVSLTTFFDGDLAVTEQKIPVNFRPDQLADVIEAVNAYADDLKNDRALLYEMPRVDHETTDALLAQETRLQKLAYWLMKVQEETL